MNRIVFVLAMGFSMGCATHSTGSSTSGRSEYNGACPEPPDHLSTEERTTVDNGGLSITVKKVLEGTLGADVDRVVLFENVLMDQSSLARAWEKYDLCRQREAGLIPSDLYEDILRAMNNVEEKKKVTSGRNLPLGYEMICAEPGEFQMGQNKATRYLHDPPTLVPETEHLVKLSGAFCISTTEVTQELYRFVMGTWEPRMFPDWNPETAYGGSSLVDDKYPVIYVSWYDALRFCNRLSEMQGLKPVYTLGESLWVNGEVKWGDQEPVEDPRIQSEHIDSVSWDMSANGFRLPTEAEWEYAAGISVYNEAGISMTELCSFGNISDRTPGSTSRFDRCSDGARTLAPVASYQPNSLGIFDMLGNVAEWVWDWDGAFSSGSLVDPTGPPASLSFSKVTRGGSWATSTPDFLVGSRDVYLDEEANIRRVVWLPRSGGRPGDRSRTTGFRVVVSHPEDSP